MACTQEEGRRQRQPSRLQRFFRRFLGLIVTLVVVLGLIAVALLQGILLGLVVIVWHYNKNQNAANAQSATSRTTHADANRVAKATAGAATATHQNAANAQSAGIVAGLAVLSAGCPTCGTSLLLPIIGMFTSAGGALAGVISGVVYAVAILVALWALKRVGREAYAIIITEKRGKHE